MIQNRTSTWSHLVKFVSEIGERPAGTPANHRAETYVSDVFREAGLQIEEVRADFPDWSLNKAALKIGGISYPVDVNPFSPSCGDIHAPTVAVSTLPELESADLRGKIALLYGELSKSPVFPINFAPVQFERDQTINRLLIEKAPLAVLAVNLNPWRRQHIFEDEDFPIPSATVTVDVGRELLAHAGEPIYISIETDTQPGYATTLIGRTSGDYAQRIVLMAHYDTKIGTPGANDNGSGISTLLTLANTLPRLNLPIGLEFIAWGDEEYGGRTDSLYISQFADHFSEIVCAINIDGVGLLTENTTLTTLANSPAFEQAIRKVQADYPGVVWVDPWIESNHYNFFSRGVPCIALTTLTSQRIHQPIDTVDWISAEKLDEVVAVVTDIVKSVHAQSPVWSRA